MKSNIIGLAVFCGLVLGLGATTASAQSYSYGDPNGYRYYSPQGGYQPPPQYRVPGGGGGGYQNPQGYWRDQRSQYWSGGNWSGGNYPGPFGGRPRVIQRPGYYNHPDYWTQPNYGPRPRPGYGYGGYAPRRPCGGCGQRGTTLYFYWSR